MGQVQAGGLDELALGADSLEEHHELQPEEDHGIDARAVPICIALLRPLPHKTEVQLGLKVAVEVVGRDQGLQRDGDQFIELAGFGRTKHGALLDSGGVSAVAR